ncbi:uncharacterized protein ZMO1_ZMO0011 [Zymomonas mobilis subsp. mobilis ZM4 = ATCC 31821]|uniref:RiboL-PSP-HEPN domain-containing protein n=1 Tax=Zymomonas mobilis subsp. mobilis (strain ATCC 31821 / ZM4 / CP4) TaxID=264203 RepID=Q5NRL9_ZYMMO|nr:conserved hypothetical protein [Zymomonas mobilis subsp. mobilis ZM4 = ATCC 31821]AVZ25057.1 hypothetical protein ZMO2_ZMO0011 [Zymomonas mobilis subsp. mobilis]AVZ26948.1 hypothetical protein ZMO3_ZMO0011 [Zymomonas mobilis subsp. mobilis]AVZ41394.1 uncharacterized protein ZMO1_ZMO0011 [Zymomonas mobilis subsp. mobilis ZM4 = ATCC 31821]HCE37702.1 hypothetical protein [Zymomonas mobilis]
MVNFTCQHGHEITIIIQQEKFEILSEMAIKAIIDEYYRDAVASFAGSLERLHEFFIRATCKKHSIDTPTWGSAWKNMSNQSERQLGAFIGLHLIETRKNPRLLDQKQIAFRNAVIHKGKFPEKKETIQFGQEILDCARPILHLLKTKAYSSAIQELTSENIGERFLVEHKKSANISTMAKLTPLSLLRDIPDSIEDAISNYTNW